MTQDSTAGGARAGSDGPVAACKYRLVYAARRLPAVVGLEAAILAAALVFACLGFALALHR